MSWSGVGNFILDAFQGGPLAAAQARQGMAIQKQDALDRQRTSDLANQKSDLLLHQFMSDQGASHVLDGGLVKRTVGTGPSAFQSDSPIPGVPGGGGIPEQMGSYIDRADPSRVVTLKDSLGKPVSYELASPVDQVHQSMARMITGRPLRQMSNQADEEEQAAKQRGVYYGRAQADNQEREEFGIPATPEQAKLWNVPVGYRFLRPEISSLIGRTTPAVVRNEGQNTRTQALIDAKSSGVKSTHVTVGKDGKQSLLTVYNNGETDEAPMDASAAPPRTGATPNAQGVADRFNQKRQDADSKKHEDLQSKEQAQWDLHGQYGDVLSIPDGETFVDPASKTGKEIEMNYAQRQVYQNRYNAAEIAARRLNENAKQLRKKWGWGEFEPGAQQDAPQDAQPPAGNTPAGNTPPAGAQPGAGNARPLVDGQQLPTGVTMGPNGPESSTASGRGGRTSKAGAASKSGASPITPRYQPGQYVRLRNGKTVKIKTVYPDGTFDPE